MSGGAAIVVGALFIIAILFILNRATRPRTDAPDLGTGAIDHTAFAAAMRRQVRSDQSRLFDNTGNHTLSPMPQSASTHSPTYSHTSDDTHARRRVTGIAAQHPLALFADLTEPKAAEQAAIVTDLLLGAGLAPYTVDASTDPALRLGLPIAADHPAPLVLYIDGLALGDFIATIDALRLGGLADRLTQAGIAFDPAALRALQDSLQKA